MGFVTSLAHLQLLTTEGEPVRLGNLIDRPTIIDVVRYYGCAPCRDQLMSLAERYDEVQALGAGVLGVGPRAAYQARLLRDRGRVPFPLLLDPDYTLASAIGLQRQSLVRWLFDLRAWSRWVRSFVRRGQGLVTGGWWEVPAIVVTDASGEVQWSHLGRSIGDYPPLEETIAALRRVAGNPPPNADV